MGRSWLAWGLVALIALTAGCQRGSNQPEPLRLAAAGDLRQALPVLIAAFRQSRPIEVDFVVGSSGQLAEQIRQGAPFDLFLSANRDFVDRLAEDGTVDPESVAPYARGALVLAINPVFAHHPKSLADLGKTEIKSIAIANPDLAPYGIAARQALERLGLWETLKPKLVPAETVHQALQFVRSGNAEVGFVGRALADAPGLEFVPVPPTSHDPIIQYLGVVHRSSRRDDARAFANWLRGPIGQAMLTDLGFSPAATMPEPRTPDLVRP